MSKKFLCIGLSVLLLTTGCTGDNSTLSNRLISLDEIRAEAENMLELNQKYKNLSLFETEINIPTTEQIKNFSLFPVSLSPEERETFLLDTVRWFGGKERDINNIIYLPYDGDDLSYSQVRDDPDRGSNYFVCYKDDDLNLGINIPRQYIYNTTLMLEPSVYTQGKPMEVLLHSALLIFLYTLLVSQIIMLFKLLNTGETGVMLSAALTCLGLASDSGASPVRWIFPITHTVFGWHYDSFFRKEFFPLTGSYIYLILLISLLLAANFTVSKKVRL
ncbi:MAG: hypothetical protein HDT47_05580 [Ruminococcaceae bacterium]|nr:hypothetical protein [Oscillospiraceae bacterium]